MDSKVCVICNNEKRIDNFYNNQENVSSVIMNII